MKCEVKITISYEIFADTLEDALEKGIDIFEEEGTDAMYCAEASEIKEED